MRYTTIEINAAGKQTQKDQNKKTKPNRRFSLYRKKGKKQHTKKKQKKTATLLIPKEEAAFHGGRIITADGQNCRGLPTVQATPGCRVQSSLCTPLVWRGARFLEVPVLTRSLAAEITGLNCLSGGRAMFLVSAHAKTGGNHGWQRRHAQRGGRLEGRVRGGPP